MNDMNRRRLKYWAENYLPELVGNIAEAIAADDAELVTRRLLSLSSDTLRALQFVTDTSQYDPPTKDLHVPRLRFAHHYAGNHVPSASPD